MKVRKNGRKYTLHDRAQLEAFVNSGWVRVDDVPPSAVDEDAFANMDADALKVYAKQHGIPIGNASSSAGVLKKIQKAQTREE